MVFHVLNRGNARMAIFEQAGDYAAFENVMAEVLPQAPMRILSYCLMPNHWHLVLWPRDDGDLARFMQRLTVTHVRRWHEYRHSAGAGHLYQGTYKSFPVQTDEHFLTVCRYVERNALRSGLAKRAENWPWGSLRRWAAGDSGQLLAEWPVARPQDWVKWVNRPQTERELDALRTSVLRGRPFGQEAWQRQVAKRLDLSHTFRSRGRPPKKGISTFS
jgi:putative transposase